MAAKSITYNLGPYTLEINQKHATLITIRGTANNPLPEIIQLDSDEAYRLYIVLNEVFQQQQRDNNTSL